MLNIKQYQNKGTLLNNFYYILFLFFASLFFISIWIFQGLDLTDTGYNLSKQWMLFNGGVVNQLDLIFGSTFFGGLWNSLINGNYLIWARFGYSFFSSLTIIFIFLILKEFYNKNIVILALFTTIPIVFVQPIKVLNYNNIPSFFLIVAIYFIKNSIVSKNKNFYIFLSILSGIIFSLALISRIMLIFFLLYPVFLVIYSIYYKKLVNKWFFSYLLFLLGLFLGLIIFYLLLKKFNLDKIYISNILDTLKSVLLKNSDIASVFGETHTKERLLNFTLKYYFISIITIPLILLLLNLCSLINKIKNLYLKNFLTITISITLVSLIFYFLSINSKSYYSNAIFYTLFSLCLFSTIILIYKSKRNEEAFILILAFIWQLTINLGSEVLNYTCLYITLPIFIISLFELEKKEFNSILKPTFNYTTFKTGIILIILLFGFINSFTDIYRDNNNRFLLKYPFETRNLFLIFSTKNRVSAIDEVISIIKNNSKPNDEILALNSIPLLYYLTERKYPTRNPWALHLESTEYFKYEITKILKNHPPKIIVIAKGQIRINPEWPNYKEIDTTYYTIQDKTNEKINFLLNQIKIFGYNYHWSNQGFDVYAKFKINY